MARLIFPVPVFLNRLAAPLCVFILGIICYLGSLVVRSNVSIKRLKDQFLLLPQYFTLTLPGSYAGKGQLAAVLQIGGTVSSLI